MSLSSVLSALGLAPKTLTEARGTLDTSKATLESVAALFTTAGLNLETLLAAGPESLKAHLDGLAGDDDALAEVLLECERLETDLAAAASAAALTSGKLDAFTEIFAGLGFTDTAAAPTAEALQTAFSAHVAKATTLALAKTGHPPVAHIDANAAPAAEQLSDEAHLAAYEKLEGADAKAYLAKNSQALWRADIARRSQRR